MSSIDESKSPPSPGTSTRESWRRRPTGYDERIHLDAQLGVSKNLKNSQQAEPPFSQSNRIPLIHRLLERRGSRAVVTWTLVMLTLCIAGYFLIAMAKLSPLINLFFPSVRNHIYHPNNPTPVVSYPRAFLQVSLPERKYLNLKSTFSLGGKLSVNPKVPPTVIHFRHTPRLTEHSELSLITQFKPIDAGVEHCELRLRLSPVTSSSEASSHSTSFSVSIFQLGYFETMGENTIFDSDPPPRMIKFGDISITPGIPVDFTQSFNCAQNSVLSFELACTEDWTRDKCSIGWWQKRFKENPPDSFSITQYFDQ